MATLTQERITQLLRPYLKEKETPAGLPGQLSDYLDLLLKWNARTNLTAIREPERIVERHFGESLFCGLQLRPILGASATILDFGSGAGFPGIPIQLLLPEVRVTLAESQGKKASFLREVGRNLGLAQMEIWGERVETMSEARLFDVVTLRAVDKMETALVEAQRRVRPGGWLVALVEDSSFGNAQEIPLPAPSHGQVRLMQVG